MLRASSAVPVGTAVSTRPRAELVTAHVLLGDGSTLRPLTARSAVLSTLLGSAGGSATPAELVALAGELGITENALRASLSRMLSGGEVTRGDDGYRLNDRLAERQRRQEVAVHTPTTTWDGTWLIAMVTVAGRDPSERAELRTGLRAARLAELREGVWVRPDNLACDLSRHPEVITWRGAHPESEVADLVDQLWDVGLWATRARHLLEAAGEHDLPENAGERFTVMAAIVRHLLDDPALPAELVPQDHPADLLRAAYAAYRELLRTRRQE